MLVYGNICPRKYDTMDKYTVQKKTFMAVFNWLLFTFLFSLCIVYVTPKPPPERCFFIGDETKCFSNGTPFHEISRLPEDPRKIPTTFRLYVRGHHPENIFKYGNETAQFIPAANTIYDGKKRTVFITHGWHGRGNQDWIVRAKNHILALTRANVITIDWRTGAERPYFQAVANSRVVGAATAYVMKVLHQELGTNYSDMYMIGWSLGAHVAGYAGEEIKKSENLLGRITGLDPATLGFTGDGKTRVRLDKSDAAFVDVIHTDCDSGKGIKEAIGHADFYPNYGVHQPGCKGKGLHMCDHARAPSYFGESIIRACSFESSPCPISDIFARSGCNASCTSGCARMGFYADNEEVLPNGTFYLETNAAEPFCISV